MYVSFQHVGTYTSNKFYDPIEECKVIFKIRKIRNKFRKKSNRKTLMCSCCDNYHIRDANKYKIIEEQRLTNLILIERRRIVYILKYSHR